MKKTLKTVLLLMLVCIGFATNAHAQRNGGRLSLGVGLLYENGMDVTLAYEHEMNYRHAWEFFANGYLKWTECKSCGHICPESFWRNYRTYGFGAVSYTHLTLPTNLVWCVDATITATCVSELRQGATRTSFLPESMWVTSTIMSCGRDGRCTGRSRVT